MKKPIHSLHAIIELAAIGIFAVILVAVFRQASNNPKTAADCPPLHENATEPSWVGLYTPTPLPISKTTDLAEGLPAEQKTRFIIRRADCTIEEYILPSSADTNHQELMQMESGDVILLSVPFSPIPEGPSPQTVLSPQQAMGILIQAVYDYMTKGEAIADGNIPEDLARSWIDQLWNTQQELEQGHTDVVIKELQIFIESAQEAKKESTVPAMVADDVIRWAEYIVAQLSPAAPPTPLREAIISSHFPNDLQAF